MLAFLIFFVQFTLSSDFPETKNLFGGVFTWPSSLSYARKMWQWIKIPQISFNYTDISVENITKQLISGKINFNLTKEIQSTIGNFFDEDNSDKNSTEIIKLLIKKNKRLFQSMGFNLNQYSFQTFENYNNEQNSYCDKNEFPNAYLLKITPSQFDCKLANDLLGQIFSYVFIIMPLVCIFILTIIFYIVFCFGRCCCFKPQRKFKPTFIEIIIFSIVSLFILITIVICLVASSHLINIMKYVFKDEFQEEVEEVCASVNPSLNEGLTKFVNSFNPSISTISNSTSGIIDNSLPNLVNVLNYVSDSMNDFAVILKDVEKFGNSVTPYLKDYEQNYKQCASVQSKSSTCPKEISFLSDLRFGKLGDIINLLAWIIDQIKEVIVVSTSVEEGKQIITDSVDNIEDSLIKITDVSVIDNCNFSDLFEPIHNIPSYVYPLVSIALISMPLIMMLILAIQVCAFWTNGCYARTCSTCCIPFSICAVLQLLIGAIPTFLGFIVIFCDIIYNQGDDVLDSILKDITNENKIVEFGVVNMTSFTKGVIGSFNLDSIKLKKIEFMKNLIDAKLDTPLSHILSFHQLPFDDTANMIDTALLNAAESIHLEKFIIGPINNSINLAFDNLPDLKLDKIASIDKMKSQLSEMSDSISCCDSQFNSLYDCYNDFFRDFDKKIKIYAEKRNNVDTYLRKVPNGLGEFGNDLFGGILKTLGHTFANAFRNVAPCLDSFKLDWAIGAFNIIRVRFLYRFMSAMMCLSVTAHLYLFGMVAMTMVLWVRRRGMGKTDKYETFDKENGNVPSNDANYSLDNKKFDQDDDDDSLYSQLID